MKKFKSIDDYILVFPENVQKILSKLRSVINKSAPGTTEAISYGMPAVKFNGKSLVYFGAFKNHISFFPTSEPIKIFADELKKYSTSKGTVSFKLRDKIPYDLVSKITKFRLETLKK